MRLTIKSKISLACMAAILIVVAYAAILLQTEETAAKRMSDIIQYNLASMRSAEEIKYNFVLYDNLVFRYLATDDMLLLKEKTRVKDNIKKWIERMRNLAQTETEQDLLNDLEQETTRYDKDVKILLDAYSVETPKQKRNMMERFKLAFSGQDTQAETESNQQIQKQQTISLLSAEGKARLTRIYFLCEKLVDISRSKLEEAEKSAQAAVVSTHQTTMFSGIVVIVTMIGVAFLLALSLLSPLQNLLQGVKKARAGELNVELPVESSDEIGHLTQEFNIMIQNLKEKQDRLVRETITDALTGLYNLRYFQNYIKSEAIRANRYKHSFALLILDIDHFKIFNDRNGHQMGNVILNQIANILKESLRGDGLIARYGGEEFVVILTETEPVGAHAVAERLRKQMETSAFPGQENMPQKKITVSIGGACFPQDTNIADQLIEKADRALYQAKSLGRNRVAWDTPAPA